MEPKDVIKLATKKLKMKEYKKIYYQNNKKELDRKNTEYQKLHRKEINEKQSQRRKILKEYGK